MAQCRHDASEQPRAFKAAPHEAVPSINQGALSATDPFCRFEPICCSPAISRQTSPTAHLADNTDRTERPQPQEPRPTCAVQANNASFLHPRREEHLIISASLLAEMPRRCLIPPPQPLLFYTAYNLHTFLFIITPL